MAHNACLAAVVLLLMSTVAGCRDSSIPVEPEPMDPVGRTPDEVDPDVTIDLPGSKVSQLVGEFDHETGHATQNQTATRYELRGTDLGVPFEHDGHIYVLFGDTQGAARSDGDAIAFTSDRVPEDGLALTFIQDDAGVYLPVTIPEISQGAYEVPMEGVDVGGEMYVYHTTDHSGQEVMGRSVVARSSDAGKTFTYLYDLSSMHFINVSIVKVPSSTWDHLPETDGEALIMFGSGRYRESSVRLAFQPAADIENPNALRYFAGVDATGEPLWTSDEDAAVAVIEHECVGELSASYNAFIEKWILLYNCSEPRGINMRTADTPWGPWTTPQVIFDPWDHDGYCHFIHASWESMRCDDVHNPGRENEWGGEYGPYQFESLAVGGDASTTIYFTMSTWNPYTVVLMSAGLRKTPEASAGL